MDYLEVLTVFSDPFNQVSVKKDTPYFLLRYLRHKVQGKLISKKSKLARLR